MPYSTIGIEEIRIQTSSSSVSVTPSRKGKSGHCKQIFAYTDTFWQHGIYQKCHCKRAVTVTGVIVTKYVCNKRYPIFTADLLECRRRRRRGRHSAPARRPSWRAAACRCWRATSSSLRSVGCTVEVPWLFEGRSVGQRGPTPGISVKYCNWFGSQRRPLNLPTGVENTDVP